MPLVNSNARPRFEAARIHHGENYSTLGWLSGIVTVADLLEHLAKKAEHKSNLEKRRAAEAKDERWDE